MIKRVSRPTWKNPTCKFSYQRVDLFWNAPSVGAECCKNYELTALSVLDDIFKPINSTSGLSISVSLMDNHGKFKVQCSNGLTILGESSLPVSIRDDDRIELVIVPNENQLTESLTIDYKIIGITMEPEHSDEQITCILQKKSANVTCINHSNTTTIHNRFEAFCRKVLLNENITVTTIVVDEIGKSSKSMGNTGVMAAIYQAALQNSNEPDNCTLQWVFIGFLLTGIFVVILVVILGMIFISFKFGLKKTCSATWHFTKQFTAKNS